MGSLQGKRVLVTGGSGFLGRHVVAELEKCGAAVSAPDSESLDVSDCGAIRKWMTEVRPQIVIHAAALCGGIGINQKMPAEFLWCNSLFALNVVEACREWDAKLVAIGSVCMYPKHCPVPFREDDVWGGYPEETNAGYGMAKRLLLELCVQFRRQHDLNAIMVLPANLYGPGDNFSAGGSHVIPALIRKAVEAKESGAALEIWGDGTPTREFLHVRDAARAIAMAADKYDGAEPVNIGTGQEISIHDLAGLIAHAVGFDGFLNIDPSKPNGQPRRCLDVSRAKQFGFEAQISLEDGIRETVEWYRANRCEVAV